MELALEAKKNLFGPKWLEHLGVKDLAIEVQTKLMDLEHNGMNVCSKCRYKSGCKDWFMLNPKL